MTAHIHSSATSKSSLFKRLVILTIVVSVLIYLAFTFSLFSVPTKFQKQALSTTLEANSAKQQQQQEAIVVTPAQAATPAKVDEEVKKPTGIVVQTPAAANKQVEEKPTTTIQKEEEEHEDLGNSIPPQQPVQDLSGETYDDFIKSSPNALVYVFSPSCSHCIQFAPTFEKLVVELGKIYGGIINIGKGM
ncbi:predicted protein [Naegleria gruberi]|uniref:Predicted protein n=1 Tax=Naegleria gruberi TaxID=5762 RepID=D2VWY2_NAEGR|nr:uncharacterized protein NAEGRDRAFT_73545 [Naegleria gruberi]EFC38708.1 predicted protein [Naegleria gruberi]|eukprot:XP_002671452.1 predicted protein [Naegleria gruberi strain NEG-M]